MPVVQEFLHTDPYTTPAFRETNAWADELAAMGYYGDPTIDLERPRPGKIDLDNPATREFLKVPGTADWLSMVPTAAALEPLYTPTLDAMPNGVRIPQDLRVLLSDLADARGLRSRAAALHEIAVADAMQHERSSNWLSLACGAAETVISAADRVRRMGAFTPTIDLLDYDPRALRLAHRYAESRNVPSAITRRFNVLNPKGFASGGMLGLHPIRENSYDLVEATGLLEYLKADDWAYSYSKVIRGRKPMAGGRTFLANAWRMVRPGGVLVVANMLPTHPQLGFTLNVIQWPHIQPRSAGQMRCLLDEAGVHGQLTTLLPEDGVYGIYAIRKPA